MARCGRCGDNNLIWQKDSGKWRLSDKRGLHKCPDTPSMGTNKVVDKDFERRKLLVTGYCFNGENLRNGLLESILNGEYYV